MKKTELYGTRPDGMSIYRTYSDEDMAIQDTITEAIYYPDVFDIEGTDFSKYVEISRPIDPEDLK